MADNHYDVLEISRRASPEMVRKAYKIQLATHHPDRGGDAVRAQRINEAFAVLNDAEARGRYDAELAGDEVHTSPPRAETGSSADGRKRHPDPDPDPEPEPGWGEQVRVDDPVQAAATVDPTPSPGPPPPTGAFPWEPGGRPSPSPIPTSPRTKEPPRRPVVRWVSGSVLAITSLAPLALLLSDASWSNVMGVLVPLGIALLLAWLAGRRRAAGGTLGYGYVIYGLVVVAWLVWNFVLMNQAGADANGRTAAMAVLGYQCVWALSYVVFVESSCIHTRRLYWASVR